MRKKLFLILSMLLLVTLFCSLFAFAGCNREDGEENKFEINEKNPLPVIEPYKNFDMYSAFEKQEGAEYSFEGYYANEKGKTTDLVFDGSTFIISVDNAVLANITVTGNKDGETITKELSLDVKGQPDVIDDGFRNLYCDNVIKSKTINYNPKYIKEGNSSLKVSFDGYYNVWGTQFANMMGHLYTVKDGIYDREYYSIYKEADVDKAWEDAVMTFWVYYCDEPIGYENTELQISYCFVHKNSTQLPAGATRAFDWGKSPIISCASKEWKQIAIRFKDFNKTTDLETDMELVRQDWKTIEGGVYEISDNLNFKCAVFNEDFLPEKNKKYTYSFYFDGVDILTYDSFVQQYPDYDFNIDYGQTITDKFAVENWLNGDKGLSFEYSFASSEGERQNDGFYLYQWKGEGYEWERLTEIVELDFANNSATSGKIIDLGEGKFRYELMFKDVPVTTEAGKEPNGNETVNILHYENYTTKLLTGNYKEINAYSK